MKFELLDSKRHNRQAFDCGVAELNFYLQRFANQDQKRHLSRIYVLAKNQEIVGYYSISADAVSTESLPDEMKPVAYSKTPFLLLGRLAIDTKYQGQGLGNALIIHALHKTVEANKIIGVSGITVDAKDEKAAAFYEKFGFKRLKGCENRLMLPFSAIKALL